MDSQPLANKSFKRIAVLTGGGDAPGMNACIRAVVRTAVAHNIEVFGVHRAYEGLVENAIEPLGARDVGGIIQKGGTILQTARLPEFREVNRQKKALRNLMEKGIEALVVIGGDGSLTGGLALHRHGFPIMGIPATIDNDIWGTNMAIGVDTAINTIIDAIDKLRDTASSHQRAFLVEVMGRGSGYLALMAGITGGAEIILIPELESDFDEVLTRIEQAYYRGKTHAIVVNSEGSSFKTEELARALNEKGTGFDVRVTILGHIQRGGAPSGFDRLLATRMGYNAVMRLLDGESGVMVGLRGREISAVPIEDVLANKRSANLEYIELGKILAR